MSSIEALDLGTAGERGLRVAGTPATGARWLRFALVVIDAAALLAGWTVAFAILPGKAPLFGEPVQAAILLFAAIAVSLATIAAQRLYLARVAAVRAIEVARLARAILISAAIVFIGSRILEPAMPGWRVTVGGALAFFLVAGARSGYASWLKAVRTDGRFNRSVVIIGSNEEGRDLHRLLSTHPEMGYSVAGVVGSRDELARWGEDVDWLGDLDGIDVALTATEANGVFVAASAVPTAMLNRLTRRLTGAGVHVHLSSGLRGVSQRRLRSLPLAYEPLFYVEPVSLAPWQLRMKRVIDVTVSLTALAVTWPLLLLAALAIKLQDGGPVLFRQRRIGRGGRSFTLLKLRTMVPDAEAHLADVERESGNQRDDGPLFKLAQDPRRTRVGRFLERTSIDELPQLFNVLRGEMSLVGPRPALPAEAVQFDDELHARHTVAPGITGLWQVEARDNPSFHAYRRLDLFYVENWSVGLDLAVLLATAKTLIVRLARR